MKSILELSRQTKVINKADVVVVGAGPAGIASAISAARAGAKTILIEAHGALGGVWTSGLLCWIIDHENKDGLMQEILDRLKQDGSLAHKPDGAVTSGYDPEGMKVLLDEMALEAEVIVSLHTRAVGAFFEKDSRRLSHVLIESPSGREAVAGNIFIDASGNGDLAALAGCGFDMGRKSDGLTQPMTLMGLVCGLDENGITTYVTGESAVYAEPKQRLFALLESQGVPPSYSSPTLFRLPHGLYALMVNHEYGGNGTNTSDLSKHSMQARAEVYKVVNALRRAGGPWKNISLVATAAHIGVREGRRIHGLYTVSEADVLNGVRHKDAVCRVTFGVDVHSMKKSDGGGYSPEGRRAIPYDIPYRALVARDAEGLLLAGRCISGDFYAHASYRVTGNAVCMGEAAGKAAAECAKQGVLPSQLSWPM